MGQAWKHLATSKRSNHQTDEKCHRIYTICLIQFHIFLRDAKYELKLDTASNSGFSHSKFRFSRKSKCRETLWTSIQPKRLSDSPRLIIEFSVSTPSISLLHLCFLHFSTPTSSLHFQISTSVHLVCFTIVIRRELSASTRTAAFPVFVVKGSRGMEVQ